MTDWVYDIEVLPNTFTMTALNSKNKKFYDFEISPRKNELERIKKWINYMIYKDDCRMVGFNNVSYDYPVLHNLMMLSGSAKYLTNETYLFSKEVIGSSNKGGLGRFKYRVWENQVLVPQIDLLLIHHFDNPARRTSLKRLQYNMRMNNIVEFELDFDKRLRKSQEITDLLTYNQHDVHSTDLFLDETQDQIKFRDSLNERFEGYNFLNMNDTKIGEVFMTIEIENKVGRHVLYEEDDRTKRKTKRDVMNIDDLIFDTIEFKHPAFNRVLTKLRGMTIESVGGKFEWSTDENLISCTVDNFQFDVGKGGLHGAKKNSVYVSDDEYVIDDRDVTSFYPSIGIEYGLYPEHLTRAFVEVYGGVKEMRLKYPKGTTENAMLKLALNGAYGKTNSEFSVFYDPKYTISTTINGQLLLLMLWDKLRRVPTIEIIQANTDGLTLYYHRQYTEMVDRLCVEWEKATRMDLEQVIYSKMFTRDVNNYLCEYEGGGTKQKGSYVFEGLDWHKNFSQLIVPRAAANHLIHGTPIDKFIKSHDDIHDFFLCTNVNRATKLTARVPEQGRIDIPYVDPETNEELIYPTFDAKYDDIKQRTSRYLITKSGHSLFKIMKPTPTMLRKGNNNNRYIGINSDQVATIYNKIPDGMKPQDCNIDYDYYIGEAEKLTECFKP